MSQFCGSFWELSKRSLLTVILYVVVCAVSDSVPSASAEALASAMAAYFTVVLARCCMASSLSPRFCGMGAACGKNLAALARLDNGVGGGGDRSPDELPPQKRP